MTETRSSSLVRPQAVGVFDGPAALVLVRDGPGSAELLAALAEGRSPVRWPEPALALRAALDGDVDTALARVSDDAVGQVNRFVLAPTAEHLSAARAAAGDDPGLTVVLDTAVYAAGLSDRPPDPGAVDGELAALALTAQAAAAIERGDVDGALGALQAAVEAGAPIGPALHGRLLGSWAEHLHQLRGASAEAAQLYDQAITVLQPTDARDLVAGFQVQRGVVLHELSGGQRHLLVEAVRSYQSALTVLSEERDPETFAFANMNVALAILALPMTQASDQVRLGVAVQSLRAALRVYRPETHPDEWSATQLNLANALQYLPSRHLQDNLAEAVTLYEELLGTRSPTRDPAGFARVLANQANALAHLAIFDHATEKYLEARELFRQAGDPDAVGVVDAQLRQIRDVQEAQP